MNDMNLNNTMYFHNYADEMNYLFIRRYLLITEISEHGPYLENEVYYNPDDYEPVIEQYDLVTALAEIDQQILDLVKEASKEEWFDKHQHRMSMEKEKYENRQSAIANGGFARFMF